MTGDPTRDHEATEHHLESLPADEHAAARAAAHEQAKAERVIDVDKTAKTVYELDRPTARLLARAVREGQEADT